MDSIEDVALPTPGPEALASRASASRSLDPDPERPSLPVSPAGASMPAPGRGAWLAEAAPATAEKARRILEGGTAENTRTAYRGDLAYFWAWAAVDLELAPGYPVAPAVVLKFAADHLDGLEYRTDLLLVEQGAKARPGPHRPATVARRLAALGTAHRLQGLENPGAGPEVRALLAMARRRAVQAGRGPRRKRALTLDLLEVLLATCGEDDLRGLRDRALLLFGWATGGRRRSEIAAARVEDLDPVEGGYLFHLRRSKTDPEGVGLTVPVLGRAALALGSWLHAAAIAAGPLFPRLGRASRPTGQLTPTSVGNIVKRRAELAGLDPAAFGGHSLRSGFITEGGRRGEALGNLMALSGHRAVAVALRYYQAGLPLRNPAGRLAG